MRLAYIWGIMSTNTGEIKVIHQFSSENNVIQTKGSGIYQPAPDSNTSFVIRHLPKFADQSVLEIGAVSGVISITLARRRNTVTATTANERSLKVVRENAKINQVGLTLVESDIFENLSPIQRFDCILFNAPYEEAASHDSSIQRFLEQSSEYLKPRGRIFLSIETFENLKKVKEIMSKQKLVGNTIGKDVDSKTKVARFLLSIRPRFSLPKLELLK